MEQGADFVRVFQWTDDDTGERRSFAQWTPHARVKTRAGGTELLNLDPYLSVIPDGDHDALELAVPGTVTATLTQGGAWDLLLVSTDPPARKSLLFGKVNVRKAVTSV